VELYTCENELCCFTTYLPIGKINSRNWAIPAIDSSLDLTMQIVGLTLPMD
jgi:hypothetical protein